jgi:glycerophosphoryl diester phosphodiesterase
MPPAPDVPRDRDLASGPPWIFGLRGSPREAPENTLASLRRAVALGLDGVAYDVRGCGSGELVLLADATLDRTTDATGPLAARGVRELHGVDAGGWFSPRFAGEPLAWLDEALELAGNAAGTFPQHLIELREPPALAEIAARVAERGRKLSLRIATGHRGACREARDLGLSPLYVLTRAGEDERRFVRDERIAAVGATPQAWRTLAGSLPWESERFCLDVDEPDELLAACRLPFNGLTTTEPRRALAARELVRLAPGDRGRYPLQAPELDIDPTTRLSGDGEWCGRWQALAGVRNPFPFEVRVALELVVRRGAFDAPALPLAARLAPGAAIEMPFAISGGSWSPGGDPLLVAHYFWGESEDGDGAGARHLALDAPLVRRREAVLHDTMRRLPLLREAPADPSASVTIRRHRGDLLVALESAGDLEHARVVVHLDGQLRAGGKGLRIALPGDFATRPGGVPFSVGIEGLRRDPRGRGPGPRTVHRRWAGGLPDPLTAGAPGRLLPEARR